MEQVNISNHNDRYVEVCRALWKINLCIAYPLSDAMIEAWAKHLLRLCPDVNLNELNDIMDRYITGEVEYIPNKGLSNIIILLKPKTFTLPKR